MNTLNIPEELKALNQWVCWRAGKVPVNPKNPAENGSSTNPRKWGSFQEALDCMERNPETINGIGIVLNNAIACIDIDGITDVNNLPPNIKQLLDQFNSYAEVSPSGNGLHIYFWGCKPPDINWDCKKPFGDDGGHIEAYFDGRYMTVTGDALPKYPIRLAPVANMIIAAKHIFSQEKSCKTAKRETTESQNIKYDMLKLIALSEADPMFRFLLERDDKALPASSSKTPSEYEWALCKLMVEANWMNGEIISLLTETRQRHSEKSKPLSYYQNTIEKVRIKFEKPSEDTDDLTQVQTILKMNVQQIIQYGRKVDDAIVVAVIDDETVTIGGIENLVSRKYWSNLCSLRAKKMITMKNTDWVNFCENHLLKIIERLESQLSPKTEALFENIQGYLEIKDVYDEKDKDRYEQAMRRKEPIRVNNQVWIATESLREYMGLFMNEKISATELGNLMRDNNFKKERMYVKDEHDEKTLHRRYWKLPPEFHDATDSQFLSS